MSRFLPMPGLSMLALLVITLAACNPDRSADQSDHAAKPATTAAPMPPHVDSGPAHWNGYDKLLFGMTVAEVRQAWGGTLNGEAPKDSICYYLNPVGQHAGGAPPQHFALMMESDKLVRYDVGNDSDVAPGGAKRGMDLATIHALYPKHILEMPSKYVPGGKVVWIKANNQSGGILVLETDAQGKVTQWHVGLDPQVYYVEGCS